jgi:hypothetical protein
LDGSTVRDDIVGLDLLIGLFVVEHLREELLCRCFRPATY